MKLKTLLEDIVNEIGDLKNIKPYKLTGYDGIYKFTTDSKDTGKVVFVPVFGDELKMLGISDRLGSTSEIIYSINDNYLQSKKESLSSLLRILATVMEAVKLDLEHTNTTAYVMYATNKSQESFDMQKKSLYIAIAKAHLPPGWIIKTETGSTSKKYILVIRK